MDLGHGDWFVWGIPGRAFPATYDQGGLVPEAPEEQWIRSDGAIAKPVQGARSQLCGELECFLSANSRNCCLISNELFDIGEPVIDTLAEKVLFGPDVYHLLTGGMSRDTIMEVISDSD